LATTYASIMKKDRTSHLITRRLMQCISDFKFRGSAPRPGKGCSPFANPGVDDGRDSVPRTLVKGPAPLQTPVLSVGNTTKTRKSWSNLI
jgi:hypothetical protein